jgi:hypothetical protein
LYFETNPKVALPTTDGYAGMAPAGVAATARWASAVAEGHIMLEAGPGFRVEPTARMG